MTHPEGGFYSAEDADSEGHEGKFYCWTHGELSQLLSPEEFNVAARYFGVTEQGNFVDHSHPTPLPGQNVLSIVGPLAPDRMAHDCVLLASARKKMFEARSRRVRPASRRQDPCVLERVDARRDGARPCRVWAMMRIAPPPTKNLAFLQAKLGTRRHKARRAE